MGTKKTQANPTATRITRAGSPVPVSLAVTGKCSNPGSSQHRSMDSTGPNNPGAIGRVCACGGGTSADDRFSEGSWLSRRHLISSSVCLGRESGPTSSGLGPARPPLHLRGQAPVGVGTGTDLRLRMSLTPSVASVNFQSDSRNLAASGHDPPVCYKGTTDNEDNKSTG